MLTGNDDCPLCIGIYRSLSNLTTQALDILTRTSIWCLDVQVVSAIRLMYTVSSIPCLVVQTHLLRTTYRTFVL